MRIRIVDAFTPRPVAGNPAGVVVLDEFPAAAWMQSVAAEVNLSEMEQVIGNLLMNAVQASPAGSRVEVKIGHRTTKDANGEEQSVAFISVEDHGQGISPENLEKIYDPFFTTKVAKKGTGLGLSVTYGIVREHGGSIEVESELGAGTLFHLEFPVARKPVNA